ncbi:hypothetical protein [Chitinophaga rhizophila]|uniref:Sulfotransferase family protein n=1 Tax=Chitinophaga rhizophila TaxID=2866212 RepID=A0ABS7GBB1_9BACT|nr:hypothetical protein [Chitinophaga rhizophila]MBW8684616.1 hypothetical protein [Chitinophaga rhizophila]
MQQSLIANWIPYKLIHTQEQWLVRWLDLGHYRMDHPFFDETIQLCRYRQKERSPKESVSTADFLTEACKDLSGLQPSAFVFHVSRCGSTLVSQAFSTTTDNIVVAEAPLLDEILRSPEKQPDIPPASRESWFRAAISLMGQQRDANENAYIIKLDSWHIHFYEVLRKWYPETPFFFLSRRPDEVIASHDKRRGLQAIPGMISPALLRITDISHFGSDFSRYTAAVLKEYYLQLQAIQGLQNPLNSFFDYADGTMEMMMAFSAHSRIPVKDAEQLSNRLKFHSKYTSDVFKPDTAADTSYFYEDCHAAYEQFRAQAK